MQVATQATVASGGGLFSMPELVGYNCSKCFSDRIVLTAGVQLCQQCGTKHQVPARKKADNVKAIAPKPAHRNCGWCAQNLIVRGDKNTFTLRCSACGCPHDPATGQPLVAKAKVAELPREDAEAIDAQRDQAQKKVEPVFEEHSDAKPIPREQPKAQEPQGRWSSKKPKRRHEE